MKSNINTQILRNINLGGNFLTNAVLYKGYLFITDNEILFEENLNVIKDYPYNNLEENQYNEFMTNVDYVITKSFHKDYEFNKLTNEDLIQYTMEAYKEL